MTFHLAFSNYICEKKLMNMPHHQGYKTTTHTHTHKRPSDSFKVTIEKFTILGRQISVLVTDHLKTSCVFFSLGIFYNYANTVSIMEAYLQKEKF